MTTPLKMLLITLLALMAAPIAVPARESYNFSRTYYDVPAVADTVVTFPLAPDAQHIAIEARGGFGKHRRGDVRCWGLVWGDYPTHYYMATLRRDDTAADDYAGRESLQLEIGEWQGDMCIRPLNSIRLTDHVSTRSQGRNSMQIEIDPTTGATDISVGYKTLQDVASMQLDYPDGVASWGIMATGRLEVSMAGAEVGTSRSAMLTTPWTASALSARLASTTDPLEGFYTYFDRDTDDALARLGGDYRIAVVRNGSNGYNIIYVSGARVGADCWTMGMLRGTLTPTPFADTYELLWYDAEMLPLSEECYATFEHPALLTLNFPTLKSKVRFAKEL